MTHSLEDPAYLGRLPPEYADLAREPKWDFDKIISWTGLGCGALVTVVAAYIAVSNGSQVAWWAIVYGAGVSLAGALKFSMSYVWRKGGLALWQRATIVMLKVVVFVVMTPVLMSLAAMAALGFTILFTFGWLRTATEWGGGLR